MPTMGRDSVRRCTRSLRTSGFRSGYDQLNQCLHCPNRDSEVGYVTTNRAGCNGTTAIEFATQLLQRDGFVPLASLPDTSATLRDEIELVRAISVKRSSAKHKAIFRRIQIKARRQGKNMGVQVFVAKLLIIDLKQHVDFVTDISYDVPTPEDRAKIRDLRLTPEEWARVDTFTRLLAVRLSQLLDHFACLLTRFTACGEGQTGFLLGDHSLSTSRDPCPRSAPPRQAKVIAIGSFLQIFKDSEEGVTRPSRLKMFKLGIKSKYRPKRRAAPLHSIGRHNDC
ncbi:hypothetical protein C8R44DRAFT_752414 [Mycena epipterygia]|nr:hypothetical protein C8R44DRAFT_752414 [Mycena epipterygia]